MAKTIIYIVLLLTLLGVEMPICYAPEGRHYPIEAVQVPPETTPRLRTIVAEVTAYTASEEECGKSDGITASGKPVRYGYIASDDLPFGTRVIIDGGVYEVADRFGGGYRNRIDIFMPSRGDAMRFGRRTMEVHIIEE